MASEHICFSSTANNLNSGINFDGESDRSGHTGSSAGRELIFGSLRNEDRASAAASSAGRHVVTRVNYYRDPGDGSPPAPVVVGAHSGTVTNERATTSVQVEITDISGNEGVFMLDTDGFQLVRLQSVEKEFVDENVLKRVYYLEVEQLLKDITGAPRVVIFDHKVRRGPANWHSLGVLNTANRGPLHRVHVDQSYAGADAVLRWNLPAAEADQLLASGTRFEIVNLWRPIRTVTRDPLAVAASWSVPEEDLVPAPIVYPNRRGETWAVKHGVGHKWFYKKGQTPEEVWLIKCFDSWTNVARRTPHSAFDDPDGFGEARESVEVRALVLHDDP